MKIRFPVLRVIGTSPYPGEVVFNAPRPLPGSSQWEGEFVCGCFYATVDLTLPETGEVLKSLQELHAWVLRYVSEEDCYAVVREHWLQSARTSYVTRLADDPRTVKTTALALWARQEETVELEVPG